MVYGDIKEVVRTTIGKRDIEPVIMEYIIASGRREIEKANNWYYMRKKVDFTLVEDQQAYSVKSGGDVNISNFKDSRVLLYRRPTGNVFYEVPSGDRNQLDLQYSTDGSGAPERYCLDDEDDELKLLVYPVLPDDEYEMRLLYYAWTSNPASDTGTDELISRWPELLVNSSVAQGFRIVTKEEPLAQPWDAKMAAELQKLKHYDWFRSESEKNMIHPSRGPYVGSQDVSSQGRKIFW